MFLRNVRLRGLVLLALLAGGYGSASAQGTSTIRGVVTRTNDGQPVAGVAVTVRGTNLATVTNVNGRYMIQRVPSGSQTLVFRWLGYAPTEREITVSGDATLDIALEPKAINLADLTVTTASREPERIVDAPAAVTLVDPRVLQNTAPTGQAPLALAQAPGVDIVQSGINDFNINARGFNSSLNRRVLTLLDGRDLAIAFLGSQEWNTLPVALDELRSMELVRGPGSALYGANAFAGVINMISLSPREAQGGKISLSGGELETYRADGRYAMVFGEGRWGARVTGGYSSSDTWTRSRTSADRLDLRREYRPALAEKDSNLTPLNGPEAIPLQGQELGPLTGDTPRAAIGDRDPVTAAYGAFRLDRYLNNSGSVVTAEVGGSQTENEVLVTGIGRVQVNKGQRMFGRAAYNSENLNVFGYWNSRESKDPQFSLASGAALLEKSDIMHVEAQANRHFLDEKLRVVGGASFRQYNVNTSGTLMRPEDDDRSDKVYSGYAQGEYSFSDKLRLVGAARYDEGDLFEGQFSPKGGIVFSPNENHVFRFTVNKAFQTPNYSEFFLRANAAAPVNLSALEAGLRANPQLGPALAGTPVGALFTNSAMVPVFARGNASLDVEETIGYEVGYKASFTSSIYMTVDIYRNNITNFVTDLLPGVNPAFGAFTAPSTVPESARAPLEGAIRATLLANPATALAGRGLTRTEDGNTAVVLSYTNAGDVDQTGLDLGLGVQLTPELRADGTFSFFSFTVNEQLTGDQLLPNTPNRKATLGLTYEGATNGFDASLTSRFVAAYDWAAGVFIGRVPDSQTFNATLGYQFNQRFRAYAAGTNIFDQQRFQLYGGAVIGRRIIGGVTATF
ncbi:MAG: TonB-dependent receptor [Gemmatimonadales bacterium]|nr:TonB-dependent receptor [Gemmatimonadales bacterium]